MTQLVQNKTLYLASSSPRRAELMGQIGLEFKILVDSVDESIRAGESPESFVRRLAVDKARAVVKRVNENTAWVVGGDTAVVVDEKILGKPSNKTEARKFLQMLSGRRHYVLSSVSVFHGVSEYAEVNKTFVSFKNLTDNEIDDYLSSEEYIGKAGGYAIQGLAACLIESIEGSYSAVMGLPLFELNKLLEASGYKEFKA